MKALLVESNQQNVRDLVLCLRMRYPGINIVTTMRGIDGVEVVETSSPDFLIISYPVPDIDAGVILSKIREFSDIPIFIFGESIPVTEKARLLEAGADDFFTKPINCLECLSVINSVLRRTFNISSRKENIIQVDGRTTLNLDTRDLTVSDQHIHLTPFEYRLLSVLVRNNGLVLSYKTLLEKVWGANYGTDLTLLKKYIYYLRTKIEADRRNPRIIINERGYGYKLVKTG